MASLKSQVLAPSAFGGMSQSWPVHFTHCVPRLPSLWEEWNLQKTRHALLDRKPSCMSLIVIKTGRHNKRKAESWQIHNTDCCNKEKTQPRDINHTEAVTELILSGADVIVRAYHSWSWPTFVDLVPLLKKFSYFSYLINSCFIPTHDRMCRIRAYFKFEKVKYLVTQGEHPNFT